MPVIAAGGDIIELEAATFTGAGNIGVDFKGKAVTVSGAGIDATFIDCQSNDRGFKFVTSETSGAVLRDLTIQNGAAVSDGDLGGGIYIFGASPVIDAVKIMDCQALGGGGIYVAETTASPLIQNCEIRNCVANATAPPLTVGGGGLSVLAAFPTVTGCDIRDNSAEHGAGIMLLGEGFNEVGGDYSNNRIYNNSAAAEGGGLRILDGGSSLVFTNNVLYGNSAATGGGMFLNTVSETALISSNTIAENTAAEGAGLTFGLGGGKVVRTIIAFNTGSTYAVLCDGIIGAVNCSVVWNPGLDDAITCISSDIVNSDPAFCGIPGSFNFQLQSDSPATAATSPCGALIGAFDIGCTLTPTRNATWGEIKSLYKD